MCAEPSTALRDPAAASLRFFRKLLADCPMTDFAIRLWDGQEWRPEGCSTPTFTLLICEPTALRRAFVPPSMVNLGEAIMLGQIDVEGDMRGAVALGDYLLHLDLGLFKKLALALDLATLPKLDARPEERAAAELGGEPGSRERLRDAIAYHYDVPAEFWEAWLDPTLAYSCAYFESEERSLAEAQEAKLDYVCRKLGLRPGERLLDMGCGWGGLIRHAARNYQVEATGVTLSASQASYVERRIEEEGLGDLCRVIHGDFRDQGHLGTFSKVASIGAIEHIPRGGLPEYFQVAWDALEPGGRFVSHGITSAKTRVLPKGQSFVDLYVFPDHTVMPITNILPAAEEVGFEIRDVECLREHYTLTCNHWLERLEANRDRVVEVTSSETYNLYRLYMGSMAYYFSTGVNSLHQVVLTRPDSQGRSGLALTREAWYRKDE